MDVEVYTYLAQQFQLTNLGEPSTFLGLNVQCNWDEGTISLNQSGNVNNLIEKFRMENAVPLKVPLNHALPLR
jgi:hypothetical protein